jgi:hypothetical protein
VIAGRLRTARTPISPACQYSRAEHLVTARGSVIVAEYFDIGKSRSIQPSRPTPAGGLMLWWGSRTPIPARPSTSIACM